MNTLNKIARAFWTILIAQAIIYGALFFMTYYGHVNGSLAFGFWTALIVLYYALVLTGIVLILINVMKSQNKLQTLFKPLGIALIVAILIATTLVPAINWAGLNGQFDHFRNSDY